MAKLHAGKRTEEAKTTVTEAMHGHDAAQISMTKPNTTHGNQASTFNWRNGQPSIFYTPAGERAAKALGGSGKALDIKGRALVGMEPRGASQGAISIATEAQSLRTQRIKRGTST